MDFVVMRIALKVVYRLLPVCRQDIFVLAGQALMDLKRFQ
jgi:hypothetical protein